MSPRKQQRATRRGLHKRWLRKKLARIRGAHDRCYVEVRSGWVYDRKTTKVWPRDQWVKMREREIQGARARRNLRWVKPSRYPLLRNVQVTLRTSEGETFTYETEGLLVRL